MILNKKYTSVDLKDTRNISFLFGTFIGVIFTFIANLLKKV